MKVKYGYFPESEQPQQTYEDVWEMFTEPEQHYVHIFYEEPQDAVVIATILNACREQGIYTTRSFDNGLVCFHTAGEMKWFKIRQDLNAWT